MTALATFLLILMGGLVTSKGAGLVVPDWPTTFGHNLFLFPWSKMVGGVFYEHAHRLIGSAVGMLTMILAVLLLAFEKRGWLRWMGVSAALLVCIQGVLGGLRVLLTDETLAIAHACVAPAFFAVSVSLVLFTSPDWETRRVEAEVFRQRYAVLGILTAGLIYLQIILGAVLRHTGSGLGLHALVAGVLTIYAVFLYAQTRKHRLYGFWLARPAKVMLGLLVAQLFLGIGAYTTKYSSAATLFSPMARDAITVGHVLIGGMMLATSIVATLYLFQATGRSVSNQTGLAPSSGAQKLMAQ